MHRDAYLLAALSYTFLFQKKCAETITNAVCAPVSLQDILYDDEEYEMYDDSRPLNCSTTESIKGGHVTYSKVKHKTLHLPATTMG